ncbi:protein BRI1-5 ENHANCED 1-like [Tripterygium wilfordii]|uniref:protein BRI1-5 ENHANCED 1-like n=1 Tax=Tripterygium wilfordii TaxID=458696 RepID=UPI0018F8211B|nr:protein BRI1-5 ENHANCED 1-like [Tripterygium wilfordii]
MSMEEDKGSVCVTGGTGHVASWLIMRLLQHGYSVRATVRSSSSSNLEPKNKNTLSFLTSLPGASERLKIFKADMDKPESFREAIEGSIGVFHLAHPMDIEGKEPEGTVTKRSLEALQAILKASMDSKTVKKFVYTASAAAVMINDGGLDIMDEETWSDIEFCRRFKYTSSSYTVSKTLTEKAALDFGEKNGLDVVSVVLPLVVGPFICPKLPSSVYVTLAMILGKMDEYKHLCFYLYHMVHIDDVANAQIFLFESSNAKGRYICSSAELTVHKMYDYISTNYPEFELPIDLIKEIEDKNKPSLSSKKLLDSGFKFKYGPYEMLDGAIGCCKQKGFL